ncbi:hypothetical protein AKJ45_01995 [candidate division MSBL1 archaeon SCGC-AAA261F19]|uniref:ATP-dependent helicase n=2 Tax=candidate division MSBL1 TaxID=215777 RepID=A0A133VA37_9EURY|nr:hypothetical protein AKJ43_01815 [candidate division MSBL1 archaeon SCGC-AAA261D19]KXB03275.1 hypothetical protein AKJ45_01995 [candidate division MSBL1 archaeon SCGC-AAA261F19]
MQDEKTAFDLLVKPLRRLVRERGFDRPTLPQKKAIPHILEEKNILLMAPAGTGKTEGALLPILQKILKKQLGKRKGIKLIYITPLRALNRDMLMRMRWWCRSLDLKISVRHGDTATRERRKQALSPPDVLITTPETLQLLITGKRMSRHISTVKWVVVDEIHELAENKRGAQLSLSLERLRRLKAGDFQIVGLSATVGTPDKVAKFLVGHERSCKILDVTMARKMELDVLYPSATKEDEVLASKLYTYPEVAARIRIMRELIENHESTLIFTNTRPMTEILTSRFKMWDLDFPVSIHHGSLSSFTRRRTEEELKSGDLKGAICTSSMELGIDIGKIDLCIQYNSPRQVTRLLQRVGRSGHQITKVAKGAIIVKDPIDAVESVVIADLSKKKELEPVKIPENPYDVLAHELVGMLVAAREWNIDDAHEIIRRAYPFRNLSKDELLKVLKFLESMTRRLVWLPPEGNVFVRPRKGKRIFDYYFNTLSMIPELMQYLVVDDEKDEPVGVLDEPFVAEYGEPGSKFVMGGSIWKIVQVFRNKVYVKSVDDPVGAVPSWVGEEIPVPFTVAQEVGKLRQRIKKQVNQGKKFDQIIKIISNEQDLDGGTVERTLDPVKRYIELDLPVPTHRKLVVEKSEDTHVVHACFGTLTNRTLARFIARKVSEELGETVAVSVDPYRILIRSEKLAPEEIVGVLRGNMGKDFEETLKSIIEDSRFFKWRIVQVARRMGALEHEARMTSGVVDKLTRGLKGTPVYEETFKEVVDKDLDLPRALEVLEKIESGEIEVSSLGIREEPSPLSAPAWQLRSLNFEPVSPERIRSLILGSTRARLLSEKRTFACIECKNWAEVKSIHELNDPPTCPDCGSKSIGLVEREARGVWRVLDRLKRTHKQAKKSEIWKKLKKTSQLISKYGKPAAAALVGRGVSPSAAEEVLREESEVSGRFLDLIMEKEKKALFQRYERS